MKKLSFLKRLKWKIAVKQTNKIFYEDIMLLLPLGGGCPVGVASPVSSFEDCKK